MSRLLGPVSVLAVLGVLVAGTAGAQEGTPAASPVAERPLDLAAMVLYPQDLETLGLPNFGIDQSMFTDAVTQAAIDVIDGDPGAGKLLALYQDTGFLHRYRLGLLRPRIPFLETSPGIFRGDMRITTSAAEFTTAEGASRAFPVIEDERGDPAAHDVLGTHPFGEQSEVTHYTEVSQSGATYKELNLTFQVGNLIADVSVVDFTGAEPEMSTTEALAQALSAKLEHVRTGIGALPGLSPRVLRLPPQADRIYRQVGVDWYIRLNGQHLPQYADVLQSLRTTASESASPLATPGATPVAASDSAMVPTDIYVYQMPIREGFGARLPSYKIMLRRYSSAGEAALGRARLRQVAAAALAAGGHTVERTVDEVALGDEGVAVWAGYGERGVVMERRYVVFVRVGAEIVYVDVNHLAAKAQAPAAAMFAMAARQVACLKAVEWCEPVPVPAELRSLTASD